MEHKLSRYDIHVLHLSYPRPIKWSGHMESGVDIVLVALETEAGVVGVAEMPVRLKWNSATVRSFRATLEDVVIPALSDVDLRDASAVNARLSTVREHPTAKSLIDVACWDLRCRAGGVPLWRALGATSATVPVSVTLTRADPKTMASEAATAIEQFGMKALKVKTGQGPELDKAALQEIRRVVGPEVELFADSNSGHRPQDVKAISGMLAEFGVLYFEDPCRLLPTKAFREVASTCSLPILVDDGCRSARDAHLFMDAGAKALSTKVMKCGISESLVIGQEAAKAGVKVSVGISATSSLGAIAALSLANSLPASTRRIPCEETFFLSIGGYLHEPLRLAGGCVELPTAAGLEELIDWEKVRSLQR